jgi:hypothetical protein
VNLVISQFISSKETFVPSPKPLRDLTNSPSPPMELTYQDLPDPLSPPENPGIWLINLAVHRSNSTLC